MPTTTKQHQTLTECPWCNRPFGDVMAAAQHERDAHRRKVAKALAAAETELRTLRLFGTPSQLEAITIRTALEVAIKGTAMATRIDASRRVGDDPYTVVLEAPNRTQAWDAIERAGTRLTDRGTRMAFKRTARLAVERTLPSARRRAAT